MGDSSMKVGGEGGASCCPELYEENRALKEREETYRRLLDDSSDPIFCFYPDGRYKYVNRAFAAGVHREQDFIIGRTIWDVFDKDEADKRFAAVKWVCVNKEMRQIEVRVPTPEGDRYYITTVKPSFGPDGEVDTVLCISKDITDRVRAEEERERIIYDLKKALSEIKELTGLLPICASCKKIRDDKGYWNEVENYISSHTKAHFSHGICPVCAAMLYPDYAKKHTP